MKISPTGKPTGKAEACEGSGQTQLALSFESDLISGHLEECPKCHEWRNLGCPDYRCLNPSCVWVVDARGQPFTD